MCTAWPCNSSVDGLSRKCINVHKCVHVYNVCKKKNKKVKLINHDCLLILMLCYIMLAYLMLFAALFNVVCLHNAFFSIYFCK